MHELPSQVNIDTMECIDFLSFRVNMEYIHFDSNIPSATTDKLLNPGLSIEQGSDAGKCLRRRKSRKEVSVTSS